MNNFRLYMALGLTVFGYQTDSCALPVGDSEMNRYEDQYKQADPLEENDEVFKIILHEIPKRVSATNFNKSMDDFARWIDGIVSRTKHIKTQPQAKKDQPEVNHLNHSKDPAEKILHIISKSLYREDLVQSLLGLKATLIQAKKESVFLPQIMIFESLSKDKQNAFRQGLRVEDRLDELPRDRRRLEKIQIDQNSLKILLIQRISQVTGLGKDRQSTLMECKRVLADFMRKIPTTMSARNSIDVLQSNLDRRAGEQSAKPIILAKVIDFLSPQKQDLAREKFAKDLLTLQDSWDEIIKIEPADVVPLWFDPEEEEKKKLQNEAEQRKKEQEEIKLKKQRDLEDKKIEDEKKKEEDAKKSTIEKTADQLKEKATNKVQNDLQSVLGSVLGNGNGAGATGNPLNNILGGIKF